MCDEACHKGAYTLVPCNMEGQVNGFISVVHFLAHSSSVEWGISYRVVVVVWNAAMT